MTKREAEQAVSSSPQSLRLLSEELNIETTIDL